MKEKLKIYFPNLPESWMLILLLTLVGSILGALVNIAISSLYPSASAWTEIISYPVIFIPPAIYIYFKNHSLSNGVEGQKTKLPLNAPNFGTIGALYSFILILPLIFAFNYITEPLTSWMEIPPFFEEFLQQVQENKISSFISIVIFAPVLEELFCRGIILRGLLKHMSPAKAIVWSALMFGIMHLNPWQAIPAFILGLLMGWIYWKTHSLWSVIFIHFVNNGFSYLITTMYPQLPSDTGFADIIPGNYYYIFFAVSLIYTAITLYLMNKYYDKPISFEI